MSQKDSSSKIKAQGGRRTGSSKYKMPAQEPDKAKSAADEEKPGQEQSDPAEDNVRGLWKSRVLASYKGKSPKESQTLLAYVPTGKASMEVGKHYKQVNVQEAMIAKVDKMFDMFQNNAYEFNRKHAQGTELECNWIRPFVSKEVTNNWHENETVVQIFSGRVSTRRWTMVVKGTVEEVQIFILPADRLIGFALSGKNFKPYFTMVPEALELDVRWRCEGKVLTPEMFPLICKELFAALIRFATDEARVDERFNLRQLGLNFQADDGEVDEDTARQQKYQQELFNDMRNRAENSRPGDFVTDDSWKVPDKQRLMDEASGFHTFDSNQTSGQQPQQMSGHQQPHAPNQRGQSGQFAEEQRNQSGNYQVQPALNAPLQQDPRQMSGNHQLQPSSPVPMQPHADPRQMNHQLPAMSDQRQMSGNHQMVPPVQPDQRQMSGSHQMVPPVQPDPRQMSGNHQMVPQAQPDPRQMSGNHQMPMQSAMQAHPAMQAPPQQDPRQMSGNYGQVLSAQQQSGAQPAVPLANQPQPALQAQAAPVGYPPGAYPPQSPPTQPAPPPPPAPPPLPDPNAKGGSGFANLQQGRLAASAPAAVPGKPGPANFPDSLSHMITYLEKELDVVHKAGSDAFAARDLARADAALKFSSRLQEFRDFARELLDYYRVKPQK